MVSWIGRFIYGHSCKPRYNRHQFVGQATGAKAFRYVGRLFLKYMEFGHTVTCVIGMKLASCLDHTQGAKVMPAIVNGVTKNASKELIRATPADDTALPSKSPGYVIGK